MKKILFISHDAYRAGAQILLLELLNYFKMKSAFSFEILLKDGGELLQDFENIATTYLWNKVKNHKKKFNGLFFFKEKLRKKKILAHLLKQKFDLIYCNTITNGKLLCELSCLNIPVITHVHELNYWIERSGTENLDFVKKYTTKYIAVSEAVKNNLKKIWSINDNKIELIHEFIDFEKITKIQEQNGLKKLLHLPDKCFIIGACGAETWRKGKDVFIPIAIQVLGKTEKDIHFVWIGGKNSYELNFDLVNSGYEDRIHFISHLSNANRYFNNFDIFLMLSREDPFPIVNLEAASLAKPILCFNNSGGTPEFLSPANELISDYLNIEEIARKTINLINNEQHRHEIGKLLERKVKNQFNIDVIASKIEASIYSTL